MGLSAPSGDWIDKASKAVLTLGIPTLFACVLLWWVLTKLAGTMDAMVVQLQNQTQVLRDVQQQQAAQHKWEQEHPVRP